MTLVVSDIFYFYFLFIVDSCYSYSYSIVVIVYSWLELLHFVIIAPIYIMMVDSVLHWKWKATY